MQNFQRYETPSSAALMVLIVSQATMLGALFTKTVPHPPEAIAFFGIAPFLSASISCCVAALVLGSETDRFGRILAIAAAFMALVSFGPHKWVDPQFGLIWPAVLAADIAIGAIFFRQSYGIQAGMRRKVS